MDSLDKKSIDSFLRVTGGIAKPSLHSSNKNNGAASAGSNPADPLKDMSVIESAVEEGENIRLILRSSGHKFPAKDNTTHHDSNPAYVVCLAHHVPSDQFILFVFNTTTMPCQLIRFDRDGNVIDSDIIRNHMCWSEIDAAVLVAAVNKCHEGNATYFDNTSGAATGKRRGECVRLVNMKNGADGTDVKMRSPGSGEEDEYSDEEDVDEDEFEVIRALILTELLNDGSSGANFHHPDPNFLLPLAESISKQLYNWRYMCNHIPAPSKWPKLPSPSEWRATTNAEGINNSEKEELDDISSGRNSQFRKSVEYCQNAIEKMKSLLCKIAERGTDSASIYELGKEGILSLTTLEFMNQQHGDAWPDYHDVFELEEIVHTCFEASTQIKENLMTWKGASESIPMEESDDEENSEWEENDGYVEVASKLVSAWVKENKALLNALSNVVTTIDQTLKSEQQSLQSAIDRVESELDSILSLKKDAERKTKLYASRIIKLWDSSCSDDDDDDDYDGEEGSNDVEEEPWLRAAPLPQWSKYDLQSKLSFGWCEAEHEDSSAMKFVIDVAGLTAGLKEEYIRDLTNYTTEHSQTKFDSIWKKKIQPAVNSTVKSIKALIELGDLRNASIVAACCLSVFCDGDTIGAVGHWHDHNESYEREDGANVVVAKKFQELWREYHPYVAAISLAYFDIESTKREAGSHWFFDILQSGFVYAPSDSSDFRWSKENRRATEYKVWWGRLSHPACEIFHSHGWQHPLFHCLRGCNNEEELSLSGLTQYEAPTVIKERFNMTKKLGRTRDANAFARILGGDHECIQYLFNNGLVDEAMVQASASKNVEGLSQLSKGLLSTNTRASVLCMQAYILEVMEGIDTYYDKFPMEGIENLVEILEEKWPKPAFVGEFSQQRGLTGAPSLRLLTTKSLARAFLCAAKSTAEIQEIFEQKYFVESGISPLLATIAIIARATFARTDANNLDLSLKHFLMKLGLLTVTRTYVSGSLTQFESIGKTLDETDYLDLVCFLYESAKFLMEEGCHSTFCFTLALFSSVQIGVRTGCISFALDVIGSLKEIEEDRFHFEYYSISPLSSLSACFSALFTSVGHNTCQEVQDALLETFLKVKVRSLNSSSHDSIFNGDVLQSRVWMGVAYSYRHDEQSAMDAIVSSIISNHLSDADSLRTSIDAVILETFRSLKLVHETRDWDHTMKSYVQSGKRH